MYCPSNCCYQSRKPNRAGAVQFSVHFFLYSTLVQNSTVQYSTVQYSTVQYSTVQCSTVQYTKEYITVVNPTHLSLYDWSVKTIFTVCLWKWNRGGYQGGRRDIRTPLTDSFTDTFSCRCSGRRLHQYIKTTFLFMFKLFKSFF